MSAFFIFTREETIDQKELDIYSAGAGKTLEGHDVTIRVAHGTLEVLEGPQIEDAVVLEFPDMDAARKWYRSPAYQDVVQHRFKGAIGRGFIVQGSEPQAIAVNAPVQARR